VLNILVVELIGESAGDKISVEFECKFQNGFISQSAGSQSFKSVHERLSSEFDDLIGRNNFRDFEYFVLEKSNCVIKRNIDVKTLSSPCDCYLANGPS
jgi:hypothetical protein